MLIHLKHYDQIKEEHSIAKSNYYIKLSFGLFADLEHLSGNAFKLYTKLLLISFRQRKGSINFHKGNTNLDKQATKDALTELKENDFISLRKDIHRIEKKKIEEHSIAEEHCISEDEKDAILLDSKKVIKMAPHGTTHIATVLSGLIKEMK